MHLRTHTTQHRLGMTLAFGALLWSGTYNALAKGLTPFLSPLSLLVLSEALTAVFIVLTFGLVPLFKKLMKMDQRSIGMSILFGLLTSTLAPYLWFSGLAQTSAINASMLSSVEVLCVLFLGCALLGERVTKMQIIGAAVVMAGVVVINMTGSGEGVGVHRGDILIVLGAIAGGTGSVLFKKYLSHVMPELAILIRNIAAIVAVAMISLFVQHSFVEEVSAFPAAKVLLLIAFTFFSRYLNLTFFYEAMDRLPATTISLIDIATPLSGIVFASLILGESLHAYQALGGIFIVFGLMLEQISDHSLSRIRSGLSHSWFLPHLRLRTPKTTEEHAMRILP